MNNLKWENIDKIIRDSLLDSEKDGLLLEQLASKARAVADCENEQAAEKFDELTKFAKENGVIIVQSCLMSYAFVAERIESHRSELQDIIKELPTQFLSTGGGGWTFLNLPTDASGEQWGEQWQADLLFSACKALNLAGFCVEDREIWQAMPGGLPYVYFVG